MFPRRALVGTLALLLCLSGIASAQDLNLPYKQMENIVYAETDGIGLVMDVFTPTGTPNGLGIVDVASGAWHSDRGKINDHKAAQVYHIMTSKGYTVFAVRPGSITKFSAPEMLVNLNKGIKWVKEHADEYKVDPARLGLMGASAGGHLACLAAVTAGDKDSATAVKATAVFFPPTDFTNWDGKVVDPSSPERFGQILRVLAFTMHKDDINKMTPEELRERIVAVSPAQLVTEKCCPMLLIHGDADPVVPLQQSEVMLAALKEKNVPAELIVKEGGQHPWPTIFQEVLVIGNWFDKQLAEK